MLFQDLSLFFLLFPAFVIAISLHEAAHAGMAYLLGDPTARSMGRLSLNPLVHLDPMGTLFLLFAGFGWAKPVPVNPQNFEHPKRDEALTAFAGPLSNFLQALLGLLLFFQLQNVLPSWGADFLRVFVEINLILCVFNLIPLAPLDGEKILALFIPVQWEHQWGKISVYGPLILFALIGLEILGFPLLHSLLGFLVDKALLFAYFLSQPFFPSLPSL